MEDVLLWLTRRGTDEVATQLYQAQALKDDQATQKLISTLVFANSKSIRTSTIILASFNVLAAFATATSILYDCYCTSRRYSNSEKSKYDSGRRLLEVFANQLVENSSSGQCTQQRHFLSCLRQELLFKALSLPLRRAMDCRLL